MYNEYFGLKDAPFSIAPNPQFLYMSERHREALAHLLYGIKSDGGFILLTGEVGTGKTTVCRCLLQQVPEDVDTAFILNPKLTAHELLATICDDLAISYPEEASIKVLVDRLNEFLLASYQQGRRTVLIIDEAQNLSIDVLEQLRLLTNLETNQRKLLQIILLGQPELLEMLARKELRQLAQRVTARFHLDALNRDEVAAYISHRLDIAGSHSNLFHPDVINRIYKLSGGVPRLINLICDRALLGAYARDKVQVNRQIVDQAAEEIFGKTIEKRNYQAAGFALAFLLVIVVAGYWFFYNKQQTRTLAVNETAIAPPQANVTPNAESSPAITPASATSIAGQPPLQDTADLPTQVPGQTHNTAAANIAAATLAAPALPRTDALINITGDDSEDAAMARLFDIWGAPVQFDNATPCNQATQVGLACLSVLGSLRDMTDLDRPAVVRLDIAGLDNYLVVTHVSDGHVDLQSSHGSFHLTQQDFIHAWDGEFVILWKPPHEFHIVQQGDKGVDVDLLASKLTEIEGEKAQPQVGVTFDAALTRKLKRFQMSAGLKPDGIAGAYTWIHINNALDPNVPRLTVSPGEGDT